MLDQNTDRMWFVIGALVVGAGIILLANKFMPEVFTQVTSSFDSVMEEGLDSIDALNNYTDEKYFKWTINSDGKTVTINGYLNDGPKEVRIPKKIEDKIVTTIGQAAFMEKGITEVVIPNSVTTIGVSAFYENKLTDIVIPNSVTKIGRAAFYGNKLTKVDIPNSITEISISAFQYNNLTQITIPNSVTKIGQAAFYSNKLKTIEIPNSVTSIGDYTFYYNPITEVTLQQHTQITDHSFDPSVVIKRK